MQVVDVTGNDIENYASSLYDYLVGRGVPLDDVVVLGVASGGVPIAEKVRDRLSLNGHSPHFREVVCRRPFTKVKKESYLSSIFLSVLKAMPRFMLDLMRVVEHAVNSRKRTVGREVVFSEAFSDAETVIIVDDAVDSGYSLKRVFDEVKAMSSSNIIITSAYVVTQENPVFHPDFVVLEKSLARFPWSLDARK